MIVNLLLSNTVTVQLSFRYRIDVEALIGTCSARIVAVVEAARAARGRRMVVAAYV